ncbi:hypothetical protein AruPA_18850 [Acidiphilium sp. PA]|uniref:hypothetical protein n=1 Tax=Acidiphilium sp. PA TaxID=2871705 RepID=UPI002243CAFC|nr:hypothetical protein [Acidiphilium sp. PA]MCW8309095.1 hypothetical protein [Acidiphilium sp. PA]
MNGAFAIMTVRKPWSVGGEKGKSQGRKEERKRFFFVKKKQKTFLIWGTGGFTGTGPV